MEYLLCIEENGGTHLYIAESHSIYAFSCLFIMIIYHKKCVKETFIYIIKCDKGHNFVICCIALHQLKSLLTASDRIGLRDPSSFSLWYLYSMLKICLPKVLLCIFISVKNFQNMELCTVAFCMFHTIYQCISLEFFLPIYQTMIHYRQSKACLVFSYFHQFLELVEEDANSMGIAAVPCMSFCAW